MKKLQIEEVQIGSIFWRADVREPVRGGQILKSYHGAIDADTIDEDDVVQALYDQLKCVDDLSITLKSANDVGVVNIDVSCDETGFTIHGVDFAGGDCPDFIIGEFVDSLRPQEA